MVLLVGSLLAFFAFKTSTQSIPMQVSPSGSVSTIPEYSHRRCSTGKPPSCVGPPPPVLTRISLQLSMQIESCGESFCTLRRGCHRAFPGHARSIFLSSDDPARSGYQCGPRPRLPPTFRSPLPGMMSALHWPATTGRIGLVSAGEWDLGPQRPSVITFGQRHLRDAVERASRFPAWTNG